jgi:autotransporter-associated beta strand protein
LATDIPGVQPAALDQPRINAYLTFSPGGQPQSFEGTFNIEAFFDTGASSILLSTDTAAFLSVNPATFHNPATNQDEPIVYTDVGVVGSDQFNVSQQVYISLAPYHPSTDVDNPATYQTVYNQSFGPLRAQIGPLNAEPDPILGGLDVFGVPLMPGKVIVLDPKPVNTFLDTMRTYVYNPGTPFNPAHADDAPGIPQTKLHVKLSLADFSRFTTLTPDGAPGPTSASNPFIGPDPTLALSPGRKHTTADNVPGITATYNGLQSTGSWLLDTGAAASIISKVQAAKLGVTYDPSTVGTDNPVLEGVPLGDQFQLTIGGLGGTSKIAGFFLDSLLVRTQEGNPADDNDPNHLRFTRAPVLVSDITVKDPKNNQTLTLDGVFGMNYLVASAFVSEGAAGEFPTIDNLTFGRFDWVVFDQANATLGLEPSSVSNQGQLTWLGDFFATESTWDTSNPNWISGLSTGVYSDGDHVSFTDFTLATEVVITVPVAPGSVTFDNKDVDFIIKGAAIQGLTGVTKKGTGLVTFENSNTYTGPTDVIAGTIIFAAPQNIGPVNVHAGATVRFQASQHLEEINVADGLAIVDQNGGFVLVVKNATIMGTGVLDLTDNSMVVHANPGARDAMLARISDFVKSARNSPAGTWQGPGIASSIAAADAQHLTGLAVVPNDRGNGTPLYATFDGEAVDANSILVKYTWNGDMDLSGKVDADDYFLIDRGFLNHLTGYANGDLDYNGVVDADDYFLIDRAFIGQTAVLVANAAATVPEPGAISIALFGLVIGARRRCG